VVNVGVVPVDLSAVLANEVHRHGFAYAGYFQERNRGMPEGMEAHLGGVSFSVAFAFRVLVPLVRTRLGNPAETRI
jgi:hypothetical protein